MHDMRQGHVSMTDESLFEVGKNVATTEGAVVFTVAPRTPFLLTFWSMGKLFPRSDRSPTMVPHAHTRLQAQCQGAGQISKVDRVSRGFYISECLEYRR